MERIFERSKSYLTVAMAETLAGDGAKVAEDFVWDHSLRVLDLAQRICHEHQVDVESETAALTAAAMYHDAAWIALLREGTIPPAKLLSRPSDVGMRKMSANVLRQEVADVMDRRDLELASRYIVELAATRHESPVMQALADAENLEEIGLIGVIRQVRQGLLSGKSARRVLEGWHRQQEYHYWEARIGAGLNYDVSRRLARNRLERMGVFFDLLQQEVELEDLKEICSREPARSEKQTFHARTQAKGVMT